MTSSSLVLDGVKKSESFGLEQVMIYRETNQWYEDFRIGIERVVIFGVWSSIRLPTSFPGLFPFELGRFFPPTQFKREKPWERGCKVATCR